MSYLKTIGTKRRPINLFFTELIIALLFFSVSGAVILRVFAAADSRSRLSAEKESAMICAQSIAEVYSKSGSAAEALGIVFSGERFDENVGEYSVKLDSYCRPAADGNIELKALEEREKTASGELSRLSMSFTSDKGELFSLSCTAYNPKGGTSDE